MSKPDLDGIIPKSNAASSDSSDSEYEVVTDSSDDEEPVKPAKSKKSKKDKKHKEKMSPQIRTKRTKLPSRGVTADGEQLPPLQTSNPAQHALEPPKPILVKQAIDNDFDKNYKIDLSKETQQGIAYERIPQTQEAFEEAFDMPFYQHKYFPLIVVLIVAIVCILASWWYFKHKFEVGYDPIKATLTGGDKNDSSDSSDSSDEEDVKEKHTLNSMTGSANVKKLPPSYEDSFDRNDDSDGEEVMKSLNGVPKSSNKSANKQANKPAPKSASGPQRDSHGRFIKR